MAVGDLGWHGPWPIPGLKAQVGTRVAAVSRVTDELDIFVVDVTGSVQAASWAPGFTSWSGWHPVHGV
jgi:hypothetical protein